MPETTEKTGEKKLSVSSTKTLTLKGRGVEQGVVRQSFSHGRTKAVVVEKVKTRTVGRPKAEAATPAATPTARSTAKAAPARAEPAATPTPAPAPTPSKPSGVVLRTLTEEERSARAHALADSRLREAEERKIAEEEAKIRAEREADEVAKKRFGEAEAKPRLPGGLGARAVTLEPDDEESSARPRRPGAAARPT